MSVESSRHHFLHLTTLGFAACFALMPCAASAQSTPPPTAPAPKPPVFNRANEVMPSWLRVRGEFRERFEGFSGSGFVEGRDDAYALSRFRFNVSVTPSKFLSFQTQLQDARVGDKEVGTTGTPFKAPFDLRMGFADVGTGTSRFAGRFGRQELAYGEQRLVGHVSWVNAARTFDGAKMTWRNKKLQVDAFAASVVRILEDEFDKSGNGNRFYGAYATSAAIVPQGSLEPYVFWRGDEALKTELGATGDLGETTVGARWVGKLPGRLDYGIEMAGQAGSLGADSIGAWAGHWQIRESFSGSHAVKVTGEFNAASGDANPVDGQRGTFDHLYPTPHDKYGLADQVGWKNIRHVRTGVESTWSKFVVGANYHSWWVMEKNDAVYTAGGGVLARVPGGAAEAHVGQELDMQVARPLTPQLLFAAGLAHIFPGGYLKQATPGGSYTYPYIMATYVFLADK